MVYFILAVICIFIIFYFIKIYIFCRNFHFGGYIGFVDNNYELLSAYPQLAKFSDSVLIENYDEIIISFPLTPEELNELGEAIKDVIFDFNNYVAEEIRVSPVGFIDKDFYWREFVSKCPQLRKVSFLHKDGLGCEIDLELLDSEDVLNLTNLVIDTRLRNAGRFFSFPNKEFEIRIKYDDIEIFAGFDDIPTEFVSLVDFLQDYCENNSVKNPGFS